MPSVSAAAAGSGAAASPPCLWRQPRGNARDRVRTPRSDAAVEGLEGDGEKSDATLRRGCSGMRRELAAEAALVHARDDIRWRLRRVRELRQREAVRVDDAERADARAEIDLDRAVVGLDARAVVEVQLARLYGRGRARRRRLGAWAPASP